MLAYLIRRLINAVLTLLAVTAVTFAIFFMVPKLTGSDPALLYIGRSRASAPKWVWVTRWWCSTASS